MKKYLKRAALASAAFFSAIAVSAQSTVTQPGDPIIASSSNSPGSEGVANAIDGTTAKYLNRDLANNATPAGFVVTPSIGATVVNGLAMQSANDSPSRDPQAVILEGSNDDSPTWTTGNWTGIYTNLTVPDWRVLWPPDDAGADTSRFHTQSFFFNNVTPYKHYRWKVTHTQGNLDGSADTCCMQIGEVQFLGAAAPKNVLQAGDPVIASSSNSPGSEGVANAIDGTTAKYLNRDLANNATPAGFVVTPSAGATVVTGLAMQSANDSPSRDPQAVVLEGSNDDNPTWTTGSWAVIYSNSNIPDWRVLWPPDDAGADTSRFHTQTFFFNNLTPYKHYRWTVTKTQGNLDGSNDTCCMQIGEVQMLGTSAPKNAVQPGDAIIASSSNSPGSEGVANAIDGTTAKYLNRDLANNATPAGFVVTPSVGATVITGLSMQSANDSPSRDPKSIVVEGSNDDSPTWATGNWTIIYTNSDIPDWRVLWPPDDAGADTSRFHTQTFYFNNVIAYKHYRWTVLRTQGNLDGSNDTCCMQIGEVQFLAVTSAADCSKTAFTLQPVNTPALAGTPATFYAGVNGPWSVQWNVNGKPIPGATALSYSTPPVTADIATNVYTVTIVGCQVSDAVHASIFTPSSTKSIGVHFWGGTANGAGSQGNVDPNRPNHLVPNDIAGVQAQAYWNVATNSTGTTADGTTLPDALTDSSGASSTITFDFTTSGAWGSGSGVTTPEQIMLNGNVGTSTAGTDQTMVFHNVPAGKHSVLIYALSAPLQFTTVKYNIGAQTYYIRVMNSDEWKPAPGFYRGTSTDQNNPGIADFVRFDNVSPDASGDITLTYSATANTGQGNATGVNGIQLILNAPTVGAPPTITQSPVATVGPTNGVVQLKVQATGDNLTYQWRKTGKTLPNGGHISGATTPTLTISSLSPEDIGVYSVAVFNPAGSVVSGNAFVNISAYNIKDKLVGYWKLDEKSGTTAANSAASGQAGQVDPTGVWSTGQVGGALTFDGSSTYVKVPDYPKATTALSVAGWVNVAAGASSSMALVRNAQHDLGVSVAQDGSPASQFELVLNYDDTAATLSLHAGITVGPNHTTINGPANFPTGSWHHVGFTADGAQLTLYIDGVAVGSTPYLGTFIVPEVKELTMGARLNNDVTDPENPVFGLDATPNVLNGQLDDVAIWNRALSADEVSKAYTAGKAGSPVDSVVQTPPTGGGGGDTQPTITFTHTGNTLVLSWTGAGFKLQTTSALGTAYTDVPNVTGTTATITIDSNARAAFYRLVK